MRLDSSVAARRGSSVSHRSNPSPPVFGGKCVSTTSQGEKHEKTDSGCRECDYPSGICHSAFGFRKRGLWTGSRRRNHHGNDPGPTECSGSRSNNHGSQCGDECRPHVHIKRRGTLSSSISSARTL